MIYFLCPIEGGDFIRIESSDKSSDEVIERMRKVEPCIIVFDDGTIYDAFLRPHLGIDIRALRGDPIGITYYKQLMKLKIPIEVMKNES